MLYGCPLLQQWRGGRLVEYEGEVGVSGEAATVRIASQKRERGVTSAGRKVTKEPTVTSVIYGRVQGVGWSGVYCWWVGLIGWGVSGKEAQGWSGCWCFNGATSIGEAGRAAWWGWRQVRGPLWADGWGWTGGMMIRHGWDCWELRGERCVRSTSAGCCGVGASSATYVSQEGLVEGVFLARVNPLGVEGTLQSSDGVTWSVTLKGRQLMGSVLLGLRAGGADSDSMNFFWWWADVLRNTFARDPICACPPKQPMVKSDSLKLNPTGPTEHGGEDYGRRRDRRIISIGAGYSTRVVRVKYTNRVAGAGLTWRAIGRTGRLGDGRNRLRAVNSGTMVVWVFGAALFGGGGQEGGGRDAMRVDSFFGVWPKGKGRASVHVKWSLVILLRQKWLSPLGRMGNGKAYGGRPYGGR
ncbi:hypothetical protein BDK51DRAFT_29822 [Blyttiomyces helicus]|uniref:Uncharacterized protein n=1 Tax=Blyttiomyces helicus TaxID=388810 RepID=A0A4P9WM00_9FUNG|nr:hypothetical protein BDK51DRAFT_29822 [Blyttiomyces helicus]|eukprot:RKO92180.1 hypothetical protein BDK51DRAFT_29822 [Blyttiomyces helicus]